MNNNEKEVLLTECRKWAYLEDIGKKILDSENTKLFLKFIDKLPEKFNKAGVFASCCTTISHFLHGDSPLDKLTENELSKKADDLHETTKSLRKQMDNLCIEVFIPMLYGEQVNEAIGEQIFNKNLSSYNSYDSEIYKEFITLSKLLSVVDFMGQSLKDSYRTPTKRKAKKETVLSRSLLDFFYAVEGSPRYSLIAELVSLFCDEVDKQEVVDMVEPTLKQLKSNYSKSSTDDYKGFIFGIESKSQLFNFLNRDSNILRLTKNYLTNNRIIMEKDVFRHSGLKIYESE